jgi:phosphoserine aminotransferase
MTKPSIKPQNPNFSSGPCAKRPGYDVKNLNTEVLGRSHRSKLGKDRLKLCIDLQRELLAIPDDYLLGIVPASDTGAYEMAMWTMLGARGVDMVAWESFGSGWVTDAVKQLKLENCRVFEADYGKIVDFSQVNFDNDVCFTWNGTTSGVKVPNADFIPASRSGLTLCDATSAVFAMDMDWKKLDVVTYSWQKVLGGEGGHGVLILSPRAVERLQTFTPPRPLPKIFRLVSKGELIAGIFSGETINTPSMLAVEDAIDALQWGKTVDLKARSEANLNALAAWVAKNNWIDFLAETAETRSNTSVCLKFVAPEIAGLSDDAQQAFVKNFTKLLESEAVAYDIGGYRDAPPGIRIWCGATVETADITALTAWLEYAYAECVGGLAKAA